MNCGFTHQSSHFDCCWLFQGLWMGQICGLLFQNCILLFITLRTDWDKLDLAMINKENDFVC